MSSEQFQQALGKLVNDERYREQVIAKPNRLIEDFDLTDEERGALTAVWRAAGADVEGHLASIPLPGPYCCCCCIGT